MNSDIPENHPRRDSLLLREKLIEGQKKGLLAPVAAIAHGRGEAFDYLLGEITIPSAFEAIKDSAKILLNAKHPVICVNGNTSVLVKEEMLQLAKLLKCPIEVNIFYRTSERIKKLISLFNNNQGIEILGENPDALIPNLTSERAKCSSKGIYVADVIFVPLEDGDRCEALIKMGKKVITVDLNPFSRTARTATITIVDNIIRSSKELIKEILNLEHKNYELNIKDNFYYLSMAVDAMKNRIEEFKADLILANYKK